MDVATGAPDAETITFDRPATMLENDYRANSLKSLSRASCPKGLALQSLVARRGNSHQMAEVLILLLVPDILAVVGGMGPWNEAWKLT